jgi:hypothetical protein
MRNISTSGVFLYIDRSLEIDLEIEVSFILPMRLPGEAAAEVLCRCAVVRSLTDETGSAVVAAKILRSRLLRRSINR